MGKHLNGLIFLFLGLLFISIVSSNINSDINPNNIKNIKNDIDPQVSGISIQQNSQMDTYCASRPGNGTASNPYIIQGEDYVAGSDLYALFLDRVTRYVIIRDCTFDGDTGGLCYTLFIQWSANIVIENCIFYDGDDAIHILDLKQVSHFMYKR